MSMMLRLSHLQLTLVKELRFDAKKKAKDLGVKEIFIENYPMSRFYFSNKFRATSI